MGRGSGIDSEAALRRAELSHARSELPQTLNEIRIGRAALQSWANLRGVGGDRIEVRRAMLEEVASDGEVSAAHPEWMTSPREAGCWVHLPGQVSLLLNKHEEESLWWADACVAPRGVRRAAPGAQLYTRAWSESERRALLAQKPRAVIRSARFTKHCSERLQERVGETVAPEQVAQWVEQQTAQSAEPVTLQMAPDWAASGARMPALLLSRPDGQDLAFLITPEGEEARPVIATVIEREWAERTIERVSESVRAGAALAKRGWSEDRLSADLRGARLLSTPDSPGHWLRARSGAAVLVRPSKEGWTAVEVRESE